MKKDMDESDGSDSPDEMLKELIEVLQPQERAVLLRMLQRWQSRLLARNKAFHERTLVHQLLKLDPRFQDIDETSLTHRPPVSSFKEFPGACSIPLPTSQTSLTGPLSEILHARASHQNYSGQALDLGMVSTFLYYSYGVRGWVGAYGKERFPLRMAPSSGGLQVCDIYLIASHVENLEQAIYYYHPEKHALQELTVRRKRPITELLTRCCVQPFVANAALVCVIACDLDRVNWKYGARAYRFAHVDAGVLAENMYLVATGLKLNGCAISGFYDDMVHALVGLNGETELALLLFTLGPVP